MSKRRQSLSHLGGALGAFVLVAAGTLWATGGLHLAWSGCTGTGEATGLHFEGDGHDHEAEPEGHEHEDDLEALEARQCEHGVSIIDCDACRFEVGVVRVEPQLAEALLRTDTVQRGALDQVLRLTGQVDYDHTRLVDVPPNAGGRVVRVSAQTGDVVEKGQVLAVLHSGDFGEARAAYLAALTELELARKEQERNDSVTTALGRLLQRLESGEAAQENGNGGKAASGEQIGEWKSQLLGRAAALRLARSVYQREDELSRTGSTSSAEVEQALQELHSAEAEYAAAVEEVTLSLDLEKLRVDNAVRNAQATLKATEQRLHILGLDHVAVAELAKDQDGKDFAWLEVRAPRSGTIVGQHATEGRYVEPTDVLYTIADLTRLWVTCDLYERDLRLLEEGMSRSRALHTCVRVASYPGLEFQATVELIGSELDSETRTIKVRLHLSNDDRRLRPGMYAEVEIRIPSDRQGLLVPRGAVLQDEGRAFVFRHWRDDLWVRRDVTLQSASGDLLAVAGPIPEGARIAVSGAFMLKSDVLRNKMGAG